MSQKVLENQMKSIISSLEPGTEFVLRKIINDPPALLGRRLREGVDSGKIAGVIHMGHDENEADKYRKV